MEDVELELNLFSPPDLAVAARRIIQAQSRIEPAAAAALGAAAVCLGLLGDALFYGAALGVNVPLWHAGLIAVLLVAAWRGGMPLERRQVVLIGLSLIPSGMVAWRASPVLQVVNLGSAASLMLLAFALPSHTGWRRVGFVTFLFAIVVGSWALITGGWRLLTHAPWRANVAPYASLHASSLWRSLALTVPLVVVFGGLFIAADAVFESQVRGLGRIDLIVVRPHFWWFFGLASVAAGVFWCAFGFHVPEAPSAALASQSHLKAGEVAIVLGALVVLFSLFVVVQVRYLFGGSDLVEATVGLTYAQYARRGFFELVAGSALLMPVLLAMNWARTRDQLTTLLYRVFASSLIILLGVIIVSAMRRLQIYQEAFGLTELRFYSAYFLTCLAAVFCCFLVTILRDATGDFLWGSLLLAVLAVIALNAANPDALIASTNMSRPRLGREFDSTHAAGLSADATPVLVSRLEDLPGGDRCAIAETLLGRWSDGGGDARGWNYGRGRASAAVRANEVRLKAACEQ